MTAPPDVYLRQLRALGLAWAGLGVALLFLLVLDRAGWTDLRIGGWGIMVVATAGSGLLLWAFLRMGAPGIRRWDRHFVYTPLLVTALLLGLYSYHVPEMRSFIFMLWLVSLLFPVGFMGFGGVLALSIVMAAAHIGAHALLAAQDRAVLPLAAEVRFTLVFLALCGYAGILLSRFQQARRERSALRRQLESLARTDGLTGLVNRRHFGELLDAEAERARRYGRPCSLVMLDLDHLKTFNDIYGHQRGDEILQRIARLLGSHRRQNDSLARYGGDEFALIMPDTGREEARVAAERLRGEVEEAGFTAGDERLTLSAGVASLPHDADSPDELLRLADNALYEAKRRGRNRTVTAAGSGRTT